MKVELDAIDNNLVRILLHPPVLKSNPGGWKWGSDEREAYAFYFIVTEWELKRWIGL